MITVDKKQIGTQIRTSLVRFFFPRLRCRRFIARWRWIGDAMRKSTMRTKVVNSLLACTLVLGLAPSLGSSAYGDPAERLMGGGCSR